MFQFLVYVVVAAVSVLTKRTPRDCLRAGSQQQASTATTYVRVLDRVAVRSGGGQADQTQCEELGVHRQKEIVSCVHQM
jgi:hypothetical protein